MCYLKKKKLSKSVLLQNIVKASLVKKSKRQVIKKEKSQIKRQVFATVTPLVRDVFENLFSDQMATEDGATKKSKESKEKGKEAKKTNKSSAKVQVKENAIDFGWVGERTKEGKCMYYEEA